MLYVKKTFENQKFMLYDFLQFWFRANHSTSLVLDSIYNHLDIKGCIVGIYREVQLKSIWNCQL
jgi:hypothetical protein